MTCPEYPHGEPEGIRPFYCDPCGVWHQKGEKAVDAAVRALEEGLRDTRAANTLRQSEMEQIVRAVLAAAEEPKRGMVARYKAWARARRNRCRVTEEWCGIFIGRRHCVTHGYRWDYPEAPCPGHAAPDSVIGQRRIGTWM